jgi:hypothetical protein
MRFLLAFILPIALVLAVTQLLQPPDSVDHGRLEAQALVWGDRVFTSKAELSEWLKTRGIAYDVWVERHPGAAPWEPAPTDAAAPARARSNETQSTPARERREPTPAPERRESPPAEAPRPVATLDSDDGWSLDVKSVIGPLLLGLLGVIGLLLITASAIPPVWYVERVNAGLVVGDRRAEFAVAGVAMLVGLGIPMLL